MLEKSASVFTLQILFNTIQLTDFLELVKQLRPPARIGEVKVIIYVNWIRVRKISSPSQSISPHAINKAFRIGVI